MTKQEILLEAKAELKLATEKMERIFGVEEAFEFTVRIARALDLISEALREETHE